MAKYVQIAAPLFRTAASARGMRDLLIKETTDMLTSLRGFGIDLVVCCEGVEAFAQTVDQAEPLDQPGPMLTMYQEQAVALNAHIAASVKIRVGDKAHNSLAFITPTGAILGAYHKCNLTVIELERGLVPGTEAFVVDTPIGRLGGVICFDLNFRWLLEQYIALKPDILCFGSMYHGGAIVQGMWAYECQSYFASALPFIGGGILDPFGRQLHATHNVADHAQAHVNLDRVMIHCDFNRPHFVNIQRKYGQEVRIDVPPHLGVAMVYSESDKRTALDLCREFGLETLDEYFTRSLKANAAAGGQGLSHPTAKGAS